MTLKPRCCPNCGSVNLSGFNRIITRPLLMCLDCGYGKDEEWEEKKVNSDIYITSLSDGHLEFEPADLGDET